MTTIQKRKKAANWLEKTLDKITKLVNTPGNGFYFGEYAKKWDFEHECGTVCCMEGWLPTIYPKLITWETTTDKSGVFVILKKKSANKYYITYFSPSKIGIPISDRLWEILTLPNINDKGEFPQLPSLKDTSKFSTVSKLWKIVIKEIREGKLDDYLEN